MLQINSGEVHFCRIIIQCAMIYRQKCTPPQFSFLSDFIVYWVMFFNIIKIQSILWIFVDFHFEISNILSTYNIAFFSSLHSRSHNFFFFRTLRGWCSLHEDGSCFELVYDNRCYSPPSPCSRFLLFSKDATRQQKEILLKAPVKENNKMATCSVLLRTCVWYSTFCWCC